MRKTGVIEVIVGFLVLLSVAMNAMNVRESWCACDVMCACKERERERERERSSELLIRSR